MEDPAELRQGGATMVRMPLVLVPGLLCDALLWQSQIAGLGALADVWVPSCERAETMEELAADILRDAPFAEFSLAGLSMGGYIALEMMHQAPARISRLALLDTNARADTPEQSARRREFIALADRGRFAGVTDTLLPQLVHPERLTDAGLIATVKTMARNVGKAGFVRQERAILGRSDRRAELAALRCPTLVLCGREDKLTPPALHEEMASSLAHSELVFVERCGHLSTLEQPEAVTRAMKTWLSA